MVRSGRDRKIRRKQKRVESLAERPERELQIFSDSSSTGIREDVGLLSKALSGKWDVTPKAKTAANEFFLKALDNPEMTDEGKLRVISLMIRIDRQRLDALKGCLRYHKTDTK